MLITILQFIIVLGFLMVAHELGHFLMARLFKVEVEEFGLGLPPRLFGRKIGSTIYSINAIPFGAFVRPKGENDPEVAGGLSARSPWVRFWVFAGGSLSNLVLGFIVFTYLFSRLGMPDTSRVIVLEVAPGSPAETAGMQPGDQILTTGGEQVTSMEQIQSITAGHKGETLTYTLLRAGLNIELDVTPRSDPPEGQGPVGFVMGNPYSPIPWYKAVPVAVSAIGEQGRQLVLLPVRLIEGSLAPEEARVVGIKGIFDIYSAARASDIETGQSNAPFPAVSVISFIGTISVALGFTNLLPLPALDGGRLIFLIPEILLRKRVPPKYENLVHSLGLLALLALMVFITIQDFINPISIPK